LKNEKAPTQKEGADDKRECGWECGSAVLPNHIALTTVATLALENPFHAGHSRIRQNMALPVKTNKYIQLPFQLQIYDLLM
jgi:hypothetical protein